MVQHTDSRKSSPDTEHTFELTARLLELQLRLTTHWSRIIHTAVERFRIRSNTASVPHPSVDELLKAYEVWIECAEQAYAEAVRKDEYCRLQAELANATLRLLVEARARGAR